MSRTVRFAWVALFCFIWMAGTALLGGCGGGSSDVPSEPAPVIVIGNSITHLAPVPAMGWQGDWGAAVAKPESDFAHIVAASLGGKLTATYVAALEFGAGSSFGNPDAPAIIAAATREVDARSVVVIELGDNVREGMTPDRSVAAFMPRYVALLNAAKGAHVLVCVSTWWQATPGLDDAMRSACVARGGRWADIGGLWRSPANTDAPGLYADPGLDDHPHEWGMAQIAARVVAATR